MSSSLSDVFCSFSELTLNLLSYQGEAFSISRINILVFRLQQRKNAPKDFSKNLCPHTCILHILSFTDLLNSYFYSFYLCIYAYILGLFWWYHTVCSSVLETEFILKKGGIWHSQIFTLSSLCFIKPACFHWDFTNLLLAKQIIFAFLSSKFHTLLVQGLCAC